MAHGGFGRSRFEFGLPVEEMWGKARKDGKHDLVKQTDGRWVVVDRSSRAEVKAWGDGRTTKEVR